MGNNSFTFRTRRWVRFFANSVNEKLHGLDFSMVYVGELQKNVDEFHGYSMTDAGDMNRMLQAIPIDVSNAAFLDVGCGKGMVMKCASESKYKKVAGIDLDQHLLDIARRNMKKLSINADCIYANATEFANYADYDVFYFYNPFGASIFGQVIQRIIESQADRNREIWVMYYHPVFADLFTASGFKLEKELPDKTRDTTTHFYVYPKQN